MSLHVEVTGQGKPLVMLHGWGMHGGIWGDTVRRLAQDFEVHNVDLPGHGASQIKGLVKYYLGVVHHWTVTRLNMLVAEIGLDDFIRRAGKLEFGTEGFEYAVALVEEMK